MDCLANVQRETAGAMHREGARERETAREREYTVLTMGLFYFFFANVSLGRTTSKNWVNIHFPSWQMLHLSLCVLIPDFVVKRIN